MTPRAKRTSHPRPALLVALALVLAVAGCWLGPRPSSTIIVMTRNLYLGADITRPVRAAQGQTGPAALAALAHANSELRRVVDQTDFATRSRLLAGEIAATRPDLVGLQEVALWRHGPLQLDQLGQTNATEVDQDFLQLLRAALSERGVDYDVVRVQQESDVEAPAFAGSIAQPGPAAEDVRLTVFDAVLVRQGSPVEVTGSGGAQFRQRLDVGLGGVPLAFVRGYVWADISIRGARARFLSTHLESQSAGLALAQAEELLSGPVAERDRATVLVCDCNSDPDDPTARPADSVPHSAAYRRTTASGFVDQWLHSGAPGPGDTSGLGELVSDASTAGFRRRLDLVLARGTAADPVRAVRGEIVGDELSDRDPASGLWPSDHAGVVVELQIG